MKYKNLGELVYIKTGKLDANAAVSNGEYPFFTTAREISRIDSYSYEGEVVLVAGNGDLNVKYYDGKFDAYQRTYILSSKNPSELSMKYLYYFLEKYLDILRLQSIGGVIKYIKLENLTNCKLYLPSLKTQQRIANILDHASELIEKRKEQLTETDRLIQSVFYEMFGDPVKNELNWKLETLSKLGTLGRGKSQHRPRNAPELLGGEYPFIQTGDVANSGIYIKEFKNTYSELGLQQSKMWPKGTLCITIAANIAKTGILTFDSCFPDSVVGLETNGKTNVIFMHVWFSFFQKILEANAPESAQKNINLKILSDLEVICPPINFQNNFSYIIEEIEAQKRVMEESLKEMENNYNVLMQKAFRGELFPE